MSIYEKIVLSTYTSFARTNTWNPGWSAISGLSILHVMNIISIALAMGHTVQGIGKIEFMLIWTSLAGLLMWIHYKLYMKGKSFFVKAKRLNPRTKFWTGFLSLLYSISTFGLFFWTLNVPWTPFLILCLVFIGVSLSSYLFEIKTNR